MSDNEGIVRLFLEIADMLAIQGEQQRRINAYKRAADSITGLGRDVADVAREGTLTEVPGIGKILAAKIEEYLDTGTLELYERLKGEVPPGVMAMLQIPDVGPKTASRVWKELGVTTIDELEAAARAGKVQQLPRFGAKTEANLIAGIEALRRFSGRTPLGVAWYLAYDMVAALSQVPEVIQIIPAGSLRRMRETIGDLDILVAAEDAAPIMDAFRKLPQAAEVVLSGPTKTTIRTEAGLQVDLRVLEPARWGTALQYFTGSQMHNVRLRELARRKGYSLSENSLKTEEGGEILCAEEAEVYERLGLQWVPPELRQGRDEIELAVQGSLPRLIERSDLQGDLQMHSTGSDGKNTIAEMAEAARALGHRYILISDHSHGMAVAGGLQVDELRQQRAEIETLNEGYGDFRILAGTEVEIRSDGSLDFPDEVLAEMDLVVASLHTGLRSGRERTTERMLAAIRNPHVDMIAHPTGRLLGKREGADLDMEVVLRAAAETGTAMEINSYPDRLDLRDAHVRRALELGCKLAINTDAHAAGDLEYLFFGVATARRGGVRAEDVINTWDVGRLLEWARRDE